MSTGMDIGMTYNDTEDEADGMSYAYRVEIKKLKEANKALEARLKVVEALTRGITQTKEDKMKTEATKYSEVAIVRKGVMLTRQAVIDNGGILQNYGGRTRVTVFKLLGLLFTTNTNRKHMYSFDDPFWRVVKLGALQGFFKKVELILRGARHLPSTLSQSRLTTRAYKRFLRYYPSKLKK